MKRKILISLFFSLFIVIYPANASISLEGQSPVDELVVTDPQELDQSPAFKGKGLEEFRRWVIGKVTYPEKSINASIEGRVLAQFIVDKSGKVVDIEILESPDKYMAKEVEKTLKKSPRWEPGVHNGQPVRVRYTLPVNFQSGR